jgi:glutamyl-tRNA synthetase
MSADAHTIADLLFPDISSGIDELLKMSEPRELVEGAAVTRYAPSPTGFLHIGGVYAALISQRIARQTDGIFILRIEDTDKQREVVDGARIMAAGLAQFGIVPDEGVMPDMSERGAYGPYTQSQRLHLYRAFLKKLVASGNAYPCFCTSQELESVRETQELQKIKTGYYGRFAKHRTIDAMEVAERIGRGESYVIRVKSRGVEGQKFAFSDLVKGELTLSTNDQDTVLLKSDGFPTYHWAHCVDDKLMQTTHVIRGDEWLSSVPLHIELFEFMGWQPPKYAHIAPIVKIDETGSKRKLSKRKDPEANVEFYFQQGYPIQALIEYLLNLANSNFEDWRRENPETSNEEFHLRLEKINVSGALFDVLKLNDISKEVVAGMRAGEVFFATVLWAEKYDEPLAHWLRSNEQYAHAIFSIERGGEKHRKDIAKWSDVRDSISYFMIEDIEFTRPEKIDTITAQEILKAASNAVSQSDTTDTWLGKLRGIAASHGFAQDTKTFKAAPEQFKGNLGDVAMVLRLALTGRTHTPDLFQLMQVLGESRVKLRFDRARDSCNN